MQSFRTMAVLSVALLTLGCASAPARAKPVAKTEPAAATGGRVDGLAHYAAGVSAEISRSLDTALNHYQQALAADPHNSTLAVHLSQILLSRRQTTNAIAQLELSSRSNPNDPDLWFYLGFAYRTADRTPDAIAAYRRVLKLNPTHFQSLQSLLEIFLQQHADADLVKFLDQSRRVKSTDATYWSRLGDLHSVALRERGALTNQLPQATVRQCYEKALALAPNDPEIQLRLASFYEANGDQVKATELFATLVKNRPTDLPLRLKLASHYLVADQKEKAAAEFELALKQEPLRYEIYNALGEIYEDLDKDENAVSNFQQSLVVNPNQFQPYLRLTLIYMKQKQYEKIITLLTEAKDKFPTAYQIPYFQGLAFADKKDYPKAIAAYADAETLAAEATDPVKLDTSFYYYYGCAEERAGDVTAAAAHFQKAIALDATNHQALNYLGYMWADKGTNLTEALDLIQRALKLDPDNGAYLDSLGWVFHKLGRSAEALDPLRRAADLLKDDDPVVYEHLADVLLALGKKDEAITTLRRAVASNPNNKDLAAKLQKLIDNAASR